MVSGYRRMSRRGKIMGQRTRVLGQVAFSYCTCLPMLDPFLMYISKEPTQQQNPEFLFDGF